MLRSIHSLAFLAAALLALAPTLRADDLAAGDRRGFADGLMSRGLHALALREYAALAESTPRDDGLDIILSRLAECQRRTGDNRAADATCARFEREFPQSPQRFNVAITHALVLSALGDTLRSSRSFDILATEPTAPRDLRLSAMYFSGENYFNAGEFDAAKSRFGMLLSQSTPAETSATVREFRGFASLYLAELDARPGGDEATDRALDAYARIAAAPATPRIGAEALFKGAHLAYTAGRHDEAVARFARLFSQYPDDPRIADARLPAAWANFNAGRYTEAAALASPLTPAPTVPCSPFPVPPLTSDGGAMRLQRGPGAAEAPASAAATAAAHGAAEAPASAPALAAALYIQAASLARTVGGAKALDAFSRLLTECPGSRFEAHARYERLVLLFKDGQHKALLAEATTFPNPPEELAPDVLWLQAEAAEALSDGGRAAQFYAMLAQRHPSSPLASEALYRSARHLREAKSWLEASKAFQRLALNHPDSPLAPYALYESGCCLLLLERREEAIRDFDALLEKHPGHKLEPDAMLQKGVAQRSLGLSREAGATLDALTSKYPDSDAAANARFERARIFYDAGDNSQAEALLRPLSESAATPEARREASFLLGLAIHAQGRDEEAAALFQPLLDGAMRAKLPVDRLVWLSEFQFSRGRYQEVAEAGAELLRREIPEDMRQAANVLVARSQLALASTNAAIASFRAAAESPVRTKFSAEAALRLAELLAATEGGAAAAVPWFRQAIERAGGEGEESVRARAYCGLAAAHEAIGKTDEALRLYMAVSLLYDGGDEVRDAMLAAERILRAAGRDSEADAIRTDRESRK